MLNTDQFLFELLVAFQKLDTQIQEPAFHLGVCMLHVLFIATDMHIHNVH
jgi:hypothetical protein